MKYLRVGVFLGVALTALVIGTDYRLVKPDFIAGITVAQDDDREPEETTEPHCPEENASDVRGA